MVTKWEEANQWEKEWHDKCLNSYYEEGKQIIYAEKMGLKLEWSPKTPYNYDLNGKSIIDIGGGPYSILLKCLNFSKATVVDPIKFPDWIYERYKEANIEAIIKKAEDFKSSFIYDEAWIYNVLQHVEDPFLIIKNVKSYSKIIRFYEWVDIDISPGHIWELKEDKLNTWLNGIGKTELLYGIAKGRAYYGIFKGDHYVE